MKATEIGRHFDRLAPGRERWKARNRYYYAALEALGREVVPPGSDVLELGCGTGELLAALNPRLGVGVDLSAGMLAIARRKFPHLHFVQADAELPPLGHTFDCVVLSDLVGHLDDIWSTLRQVRGLCRANARVLITYYNFLWQPLLKLGERAGLKMTQAQENWLGMGDIENLLHLTGYRVEQAGVRLLLPKGVPIVADWVNRALVEKKLFRWAALVHFYVAAPAPQPAPRAYSVSVVVPCRNEVGNVADCVRRMPAMGSHTEIVFVDGASTDGTLEAIEREMKRTDIKLIHQVPREAGADGLVDTTRADMMLSLGKGDAVRKGFAAASGDVLMILDADLTVPPEDLPHFYLALAERKGDFVNGTRLVYPLEEEAMKFLNLVGNKLFSWVFTWLLGQRVKDTLCGTKVLFKRDYEQIAANRAYFGDFDPFGDFDLLFGAARLGLKIVEMPVRYRRRRFGDSKVRVFKHGMLLLRMSWFGFRKLKLGPVRLPVRRTNAAQPESGADALRERE